MKRVLLSLPNSLLRKYVLNHFTELSVDDFFAVIKRINIPSGFISTNELLSTNSDVLSYMIDRDMYSFTEFKLEAFNTLCVEKISLLDYFFDIDVLSKYPVLLDNFKILEKAISRNPLVVNLLDVNKFNKDVVGLLEGVDYVPDEAMLDRYPILLDSNILMERCVRVNPNLLRKLSNPSDRVVSVALDKGFIPVYDDFVDNYSYRNKYLLLAKGFENDPSILVYFSRDILDEKFINSAIERGYIATKSDLLFNESFRYSTTIMESSIKANPELIKYVTKYLFLNYDVVKDALSSYKVTKDDLFKYPEMATNRSVMRQLPEYKFYTPFLDEDDKVNKIVDSLKISKTISIDSIPFLDTRFGSNVDINKLNRLMRFLDLYIDQDSVTYQENCMNVVDKLVDGITTIRYAKNKDTFLYSDVVAINDSLLVLFNEVSSTNDYSKISKFVDDLYKFSGGFINRDVLKLEVEKFYNIYKSSNIVDLSISSEFCNDVLNQHRNAYMSKEKFNILNEFKSSLNLNTKKKSTILNGKKIDKVSKLIVDKNYESLGITESEFLFDLENVGNSLLVNKKLIKMGIKLDSVNTRYFIDIFKSRGSIDFDIVKSVVNNEDGAKFIVKSFEQIKFKYVNNISLDEDEALISESYIDKLGFNYSNFLIGDNDKYLDNVANILINIDEESVDKILDGLKTFEVVDLLPFINLSEELNIDTFINILSEYERIKSKVNINSVDDLLVNIADVINLANAYRSINDINLFALGSDVVCELGEYYSNSYLDFYTKMIQRTEGGIPSIKIDTDKYHLESGCFSDVGRLLIGKVPKRDSCIDLINPAGTKTYCEALLENSGDVVLIRDKENKLVSRLLIFRRGNMVQIISSAGNKLSNKLYKSIADQIITESTKSGDNLDFVFVNEYSIKEDHDYLKVGDPRFVNEFPHADTNNYGVLFSSKGDDVSNVNFKVNPLCSYIKPRRKISFNPSEEEITRLRALGVVLENDFDTKEIKSRNFEPFYSKDFVKVISGEDWYIAVKEDGSFEEVVLPLFDERILKEVNSCKESLGINRGVSL